MNADTHADLHSTDAAVAMNEPEPKRSNNEPHAASATPARAPRRIWPWVLLALVVLFAAAVVSGVLLLGGTLEQALGGIDIRIDGERVLYVPREEATAFALAAAIAAAGVAVLIIMVVVPVALLVALVLTALALGAALVAVLAVAAVVLSPLWVLTLLLWLALREPRRGAAA